ncbi:MAG: hypothetical protein ACTHN5_06875 [Phycisphaerae bacterium]
MKSSFRELKMRKRAPSDFDLQVLGVLWGQGFGWRCEQPVRRGS